MARTPRNLTWGGTGVLWYWFACRYEIFRLFQLERNGINNNASYLVFCVDFIFAYFASKWINMIFFFLAPSILYWRGIRITYLGLKLCSIFLSVACSSKGAAEEDIAISHMVEWDSHNHMILTWIRNTSISSISNLLGSFDDAKSTWNMLAKRYSTSRGSMKYQLVVKLHQLRQEPGQSINGYYDQLHFIWDQIDLSDLTWACSKDAQQYATVRD